MSKFLVNLYGWGDCKVCSGEGEFDKGDKVVVEDEAGKLIGQIEKVLVDDNEINHYEQKNGGDESQSVIVRRATKRDLENFEKNHEKRRKILDDCRREARRMGLDMKFVDACVTLGKGVIVVSFIADGRVDFRQLVKNLSRMFHCSVRMHQIGSRDEARKLGGCGVCGKELCCVKFLGEIPSISTEMAKVQQVAQRGSDRISGVCGRLLCCLSYEADQYREMLKGMPEVGSRVKTEKTEGVVVEINPLKQEIKLRVGEGKDYVIIKREDIK